MAPRHIKSLYACPEGNIQLFRERLSEKEHATILKGSVGGFEFTVLQRNLKELARKAMKMCLRVLTERNKSRFDSYSRQKQCIDHIPYYLSGLSRAHFFPTTFPGIAVYRQKQPIKIYFLQSKERIPRAFNDKSLKFMFWRPMSDEIISKLQMREANANGSFEQQAISSLSRVSRK